MQLSVRELAPAEQVRMHVDEAGKLYDGHFILFTNSEEKWENDRWEKYAIPRIISVTMTDFYDSKIYKKYLDSTQYGITYSCSAYMAEENIPPVLAF